MASQHFRTAAAVVITFFTVPWGAFVAAFLFYVGLTLVAIGGEPLPDTAMAAAYLLPVTAYVLVLMARALRALAAVPVNIGQLAVPRLQ